MRFAPRIYGGFQNTVTGQNKVKKSIKIGRMVGKNKVTELVQNHKFNIFQRQPHEVCGKHNACFCFFFTGNFTGAETALAGAENKFGASAVIRCFYGMLQTKTGALFLKDLPQRLIIIQ